MDQITIKERMAIIRTRWGNKFRVDELCSCGHLRSEHQDTWPATIIRSNPDIAASIVGHGECAAPESSCACQKFTWKKTIFRTPRDRRRVRK
jgi:hypothetical protein